MQKGVLQAPGRRVLMEENISQADRMQGKKKKKVKEDNKLEGLWLLKTLPAKCRTAETLSKLAVSMM